MNTYFDDVKNRIVLKELNEVLNIDNKISLINEDGSGVLDTITGGLSQAWEGIKTAAGDLGNTITNSSAWKGIRGWLTGVGADGKQTNGYSLAGGIKKLGDMMTDPANANLTTAGLLGAGVLGTWYLLKKRKEKKNVDANDFKHAMQLDQLKQLPPAMAGKRVNIRDCV